MLARRVSGADNRDRQVRKARPTTALLEVDVVADIVRARGEPIVENASAVIVFVGMPIDAAPALIPSERNEAFDKLPLRWR